MAQRLIQVAVYRYSHRSSSVEVTRTQRFELREPRRPRRGAVDARNVSVPTLPQHAVQAFARSRVPACCSRAGVFAAFARCVIPAHCRDLLTLQLAHE